MGDQPALGLRCRAGGYQPPLTLAKPLLETQAGLGGATHNNDDSHTEHRIFTFGEIVYVCFLLGSQYPMELSKAWTESPLYWGLGVGGRQHVCADKARPGRYPWIKPHQAAAAALCFMLIFSQKHDVEKQHRSEHRIFKQLRMMELSV